MKTIASRALAALILGLIWLSAAPAESNCKLVFEAIPSVDAGAIIGGQSVEHNLAGKSFATWREFTKQQAGPIFDFLDNNFRETVSYDVPGKSQPVSQENTVSGGMSHIVAGIPFDATNLTVTMDFEAGPTLHQAWATPLSQIPTGAVLLDIYGVWADPPQVVVHNIPQPS